MRIEKTDMADEEEVTTTVVEAESLAALGRTEMESLATNDRFEPCYGREKEFKVVVEDNQMWIVWLPGDGGEYTIAEYRVL